jgi:hypothetical protein
LCHDHEPYGLHWSGCLEQLAEPCSPPFHGGLVQSDWCQDQSDQEEVGDDCQMQASLPLREEAQVLKCLYESDELLDQFSALVPTAGWSYPHGFVLGCWGEVDAGDQCEMQAEWETFVRVDY